MTRPQEEEDWIYCRSCNAILGQRSGSHVVQKHRGRTTVMAGVVSITCERCHTVTRPGGRRAGQAVERRDARLLLAD